MRPALIVFAKVPRPGAVKTRLSPPLTPSEAAELYDAFLHDALEIYERVDADVRLYLVDGPTETEQYPRLETFFQQTGEGLGERMSNAFAETFSAGYDRVCIIGTDHPTIESGLIDSAFASLADNDLVVGPSLDGGYYLMGMKRLHKQLFSDMLYSHGDVFEDTIGRARSINLTTRVLMEWYDVDDLESLRLLIRDLENHASELPRTRRIAGKLMTRYPADLYIEKSA